MSVLERELSRDARVITPEGVIGRVAHVIVDATTHQVTDLVVDRGGRLWLLGIEAVDDIDADGVRVHRAWSETAAREFDRHEFRPVKADDGVVWDAAPTSRQRVVTQGAPLAR